MLAQAAVIPLSGWLSDRFGAKRVYLTSLVLFTLGSALCGLAASAQALVVTRVLQGLGGGMMMPIGMSVLYRLTPPAQRGAVMGMFGVPILVAPALGPVLSGYLLQYADWRLIFLINVPIGVVALLAGLRALPAIGAPRPPGPLDAAGVVLGPVAFASLSFGISESTHAGWTGATTLGGIVLGLAALGLFIRRELRFAHPLLELRVFRSRDFTLAILTQWIGFGALFGTFFLVPLFLQQVRGYGSFQTGLFTLPQALASALFMPLGGRLFDRIGARPPVLFGLALVVAAMWLMSGLSGITTGEDLRLPLILMGAGMGAMMMSLSTHILNSAPRDLVSRVTSLTNALQNVVSSLAIASFATVLQGRLPVHVAQATAVVGGSPGPEALANASAQSFGDVYRIAMVGALVAWAVAWTLRRPVPSTAAGTAGLAEPDNTLPREAAALEEQPDREPVFAGL
jgi:EmrB/QacA subfamily drug resistance transporter